MSRQKLTGTICVDGHEFLSEFSTVIHQSGFFYARSEGQVGVEQIQVHVQPFTADMLMRPPIEPNVPLVYELQGNHIGGVRFGSDDKEGEWRTWDLRKVLIGVTRFFTRPPPPPPIEPNAPLVYELKGNHIGRVRFGSDNKEGEWRTWDLRKVLISVTRFSNGMSIRFEIGTDRGAFTFQGGIDETTIGKLAPVDYWFMVFVPIDILQEFLHGEPQTERIDPDSLIKKFVESLHTAGLEPHTS